MGGANIRQKSNEQSQAETLTEWNADKFTILPKSNAAAPEHQTRKYVLDDYTK